MADRKSRIRKLFQVVAALSILLLLLIVTIPLWFPWTLSPLARSVGIQVGGYQRIGYGRLQLEDVRYAHQGTTIEIGRAEVFQPTAWLWHRYFGDRTTETVVRISEWTVDIQKSGMQPRPGSSPSTNSTAIVLDQVQKYLTPLRGWLPSAELTNGSLTIHKQRFTLPWVKWRQDRLKARIHSDQFAQSATMRLTLPAQPPYALYAEIHPLGLVVDSFITESNRHWSVATDLWWRTNKATLAAQFQPDGWLPSRLAFNAPAIRVPADMLYLRGYHDPTGSVHLAYSEGAFNTTVSADSSPETDLPPLHVDLAGRGTLQSATLERLQVNTPAVRAQLTQPITVDRSGKLLSGSARLEIDADLAHLPNLNLRGGVTGLIRISPGSAAAPRAEIELRATNLLHARLAARSANLSGTLNWPMAEAVVLAVTLTNGSQFQVTGNADLEAKHIAAGAWKFEGAVANDLVPAGVSVESVQAAGKLDGPLWALQHSGHITAKQLVTARTLPMDVDFDWNGTNTALTSAGFLAHAGKSRLTAEFSSELSTNPGTCLAARMTKLTVERGEEVLYRLTQPFDLSFQHAADTNTSWMATLSDLFWEGGERSLHIAGQCAWPNRGEVRLELHKFEPEFFSDFIVIPTLELALNDLELRGSWDRSPLFLTLRAKGFLTWPDEGMFSASVDLTCNQTNVTVEEILVEGPTGPLLSFDGTVPLLLTPASSNWFHFVPDGEISLHGYSATNRTFWERLSHVTKVDLVDPLLRLDLHGTPDRPEGTLLLSARQVQWTEVPEKMPMPPMQNLSIKVKVHEKALVLEQFQLEIAGQPVIAHATVPLNEAFWPQFVEQKALPDWRQLSGRFQIPNAELAPFAHYVPKLLAPQGRLALDLQVAPGFVLHGGLRLTNAATRPLSSLGSVRDVEVAVLFEQQSATIQEFTGHIGGQPVHLDGKVQWTGGALPDFQLRLTGSAVPLVRQSGTLVRSDLNVTFIHTNNQPVRVSGEVKLTNSFFLQDIAALIPRGVAQPSQRPPYFSVDQEPFSNWQLDLRIQGDRFLKVRSPLFRGEVSTRLELKGSLKEPVALGQVSLHQSVIQFPFGNLQVDQGLIDLTSENPHDPQLLILASGRVFGYNVKLEVTGPATAPILAFSSTPPLSSEQIILMVTAGELPKRETGFSSQQKAGRLALFLGRDLLTKVAGNDAAERLSISSGENISDQGDLTYYLEFKLNKDWSVIGEYDRFNELNAGLKWHLYSK